MNDVRFAELISRIAHELRSPLTSVKGFSGTLVKRWDRFTDEQRLQFVETIHSDAERMGRIVSEVLDLARLEAGRLELDRRAVDVAAIVATAVGNLSQLPGAERVRIDVPDDLMAWGDPERLAHVVGNLIENALKFSDEGPVTIAARRRDGGVEISVTDEGVGIPAGDIDAVFAGPGAPGRAATPSGSGLGLYLTRGLVEAHGGTIEVASRVDEGAMFTVRLPGEDR